MEFLLSFIFGLIFGSFLNVLIYRLKNGRRFGGRSFCPRCKTSLKWLDLVPLLSFAYLRGRCRYCRKKISWQYPIIEVLSGLIWILVFYKIFGFNFQPSYNLLLIKEEMGVVFNLQFLNFIYYIIILSILLVIAVYDAKWKIIPDKIIYPAIIVAFIYNALSVIRMENLLFFITHIIIAFGAFLFFFLIYFFSKGRAMGLGDAKLAFLISLFLKPLPSLIAFNAAFVIGAVYSIILLALGKKTLKSQIAFGPFLIIGAVIAFFMRDYINNFFIF